MLTEKKRKDCETNSYPQVNIKLMVKKTYLILGISYDFGEKNVNNLLISKNFLSLYHN